MGVNLRRVNVRDRDLTFSVHSFISIVPSPRPAFVDPVFGAAGKKGRNFRIRKPGVPRSTFISVNQSEDLPRKRTNKLCMKNDSFFLHGQDPQRPLGHEPIKLQERERERASCGSVEKAIQRKDLIFYFAPPRTEGRGQVAARFPGWADGEISVLVYF